MNTLLSWSQKEILRVIVAGAALLMTICFSSPTFSQIHFTRQTDHPVVPLGEPGAWDDGFLYNLTVIRDGSTYKMWYQGGHEEGAQHIGWARSTDGIIWLKHPQNPVLSPGGPGEWDQGAQHGLAIGPGTVILEGTTYHMWYFGHNANDTVHGIGYATSPDGVEWTKHENNPVVSTGGPGSWDHHVVTWPAVVLRDGTFHMWYGGNGDHDVPEQIGYATSEDGVTWTKHEGNPVLAVGPHDSWDSSWARQPQVIFDGAKFHMWYHGASHTASSIGYASSDDGINWTKHRGNPVFGAGPHGSWDNLAVTNAAVIHEGSAFKMWYAGVGLFGEDDHGDDDHGHALAKVSFAETAAAQQSVLFQIGYAIAPEAPAESVISSVEDVPEDQGNQVRIVWTSSRFDGLDHAETVIEYNLWRQVAGQPLAKSISTVSREQLASEMQKAKSFGGQIILEGTLWDYITTVPAHQFVRYAYVAPTLVNATEADTVFTAFMVSAHTSDPTIFYDSAPAAGFSVDNLAPAAPANFLAKEVDAHGASAIMLSWDESPEPDFAYFALYKDEALDPLAQTTQLSFLDTDVATGQSPRYQLSAFDVNGNEGERAEITLLVTSVDDGPEVNIPSELALHQNYPNPFNPETEIRFDLPRASEVVIRIFNVLGKHIRTLTDETWRAGSHKVRWNGRDDRGEPVASGVYVYELQAGDPSAASGQSFRQVKKMSLLR